MNFGTELSMPLSASSYKRLVTGEDCQVVAVEAIRDLLERTMDSALKERIAKHVEKHGRGSDRRNGSYERTLVTSVGWLTSIRVPRGRVCSVADVVIERYKRRQPEFDAAVIRSFLLGHSTRKSKRFFEGFLNQTGVSATTVSRILSELDERCRAWRSRPLVKPYAYLWLDGKCAKIRRATKRPYSVLWAYGACEDGHRELLGFQIHYSEGTAHWESLLVELINRGLEANKLKLVIRDENSGAEQAVLSLLGDVKQQSCSVHLERNLGKLVGRLNRKDFQSQVSEIFKQSCLREAHAVLSRVLENWKEVEPEACLYLRANVDKSLVFYSVADSQLWRTHLKSTNMLERFFRELKRFEKARQFRFIDTSSCERFYYAFASIYNQDHPRMPRPRKTKSKSQRITYNLSKQSHSDPSAVFLNTDGIQLPSQKGISRNVAPAVRNQEQRSERATLIETEKRNASSSVTQNS
jgi:putative transposase